MKTALRNALLLGGATLAALAAACSDGGNHHSYPVYAPGAPVQDDAGTSPTGSSTPSANPLLVDVDPNQTLSAVPGDGAGVFIEYSSGGHWHVWWTCDTNKTQLSCAWDVTIAEPNGSIVKAAADASSTTIGTSSGTSLDATSTTGANLDGVRFDTAAGATITVTASIGGVYDGSFLFFVQNGKINGGYAGTLTDPLKLEPASP
jgi:hypothetical protein